MRVKTSLEDGLLDVICWGRDLLGRWPLLFPNSKSITIMGSRAISRSGGARCVDTEQSAHVALYNVWSQAEKRHIWLRTENSRETSLPFPPASGGGIQGWGSREMTLGSRGYGAKQRVWDPEREEGELINALPCLPLIPPFPTPAAARTTPEE